jgi:hypothetical protein
MKRYYEDRRSGGIYSLAELARLIEEQRIARFQVPRRFRALPEAACRLLHEAELVAAAADRRRDQLSA